MSEMRLNEDNFRKGFLIDPEWMGGITENASNSGLSGGASSETTYSAFVVSHETGEYVAFQEFSLISEALDWLYSFSRPWQFEFTSACGGCSKQSENGGKCPGGVCAKAEPSKLATFVGTNEVNGCGSC